MADAIVALRVWPNFRVDDSSCDTGISAVRDHHMFSVVA